MNIALIHKTINTVLIYKYNMKNIVLILIHVNKYCFNTNIEVNNNKKCE